MWALLARAQGRAAEQQVPGADEGARLVTHQRDGRHQIAAALYLSPKTVRHDVSNVPAKLRVTDRAQAILRARDAELGR